MQFLTILKYAGFLAVATAAPTSPSDDISQCSSGTVLCCNSVQSASTAPVGLLLGLLGVVVPDSSVSVGLTCSPITVVGVGAGAQCAQQPVCCKNNTFNGLVAVDCKPVTL